MMMFPASATTQTLVWSWGAGTNGQLGTGASEDSHVASVVSTLSGADKDVEEIACGGSHAVAVYTCKGERHVATWGWGTGGALGHGDLAMRLTPCQVAAFQGISIRQVAAGWNHTVFISDAGEVYACGDGAFGQLGLGRGRGSTTPVRIHSQCFGRSHAATHVACGLRHTLVLCQGKRESGGEFSTVFAWGAAKRGQTGVAPLGSQTLAKASCPAENQVPPASAISEEEPLPERANEGAPLGRQGRMPAVIHSPQEVRALRGLRVVSLSAGGDHSSALTEDGQLLIWGRAYSQGHQDLLEPTWTDWPIVWCQVALGWHHGIGIAGNGGAWCWGSFRHAQARASGPTPDHVTEAGEAAERSEGQERKDAKNELEGEAAEAVEGVARGLESGQEGRAYCGGETGESSRNRGTQGLGEKLFPVHFGGKENVMCVAAGAEHLLAALDNGSIMSWGWGEHGQLGHGETRDLDLPKAVMLQATKGEDLPALPSQDRVGATKEPSDTVRVRCGSGFSFALWSRKASN